MATISGKWQFNTTLTTPTNVMEIELLYTSNGTEFNYISTATSNNNLLEYGNHSNGTIVTPYSAGYWANSNYRIVDFGSTEQDCPDVFYTWFTANAVTYVEPTYGSLKVYSNNGATTLKTISIPTGTTAAFSVTSSGFSGGSGSYTYNGDNTFLGVANAANATTPTYAVGSTFSWTSTTSGKKVYIVEDETSTEPPSQTSSTKITYNGSTIASIKTGQTITLNCAGKLMKSDLVVKAPETTGGGSSAEATLTTKEITSNGTYNASDDGADGYSKVTVNVPAPEITSEEKTVTPIKTAQTVTPTNADYLSKVTVEAIPNSYIKPSGSKTITENGTHNVKKFESVTVNVPTSGGGGGECDKNHIIEVDTLPTENIDEAVLYKMGDSYYKYSEEFKDMLLAYSGTVDSYIEIMADQGMFAKLYYAKTRPTENIEISVEEMMHLYYVEDEDSILAYGDFEESGTNAWMSLSDEMPYGGAITDVSQITPSTDYSIYALVSNGYKEYISPSGKLTITENGTFDVLDKSSVDVNVPEKPDSPLPIEISTKSEMIGLLETAETGSVYKYTGTSTDYWNPNFYENGALYTVVDGQFKHLVQSNTVRLGNFLTFYSPVRFEFRFNEYASYNATKSWDGILEYSTDAVVWHEYDGSKPILSSVQGVLYLRGTGNTFLTTDNTSSSVHIHINSITDYHDYVDVYCSGNIENLLDYETVANGEHPPMAEKCYQKLFSDCRGLKSAPTLPATTLTPYCYFAMFENCHTLERAPELPATVLADSCYDGMFWCCYALKTAPALPATVLADSCYDDMFYRCTSLTTIPALPARGLLPRCYAGMFNGCTNVKMSTSKTDEYKTAYKIPVSGDGEIVTGDPFYNMFSDTGGTFTSTPSINTTYYTSNPVISLIV